MLTTIRFRLSIHFASPSPFCVCVCVCAEFQEQQTVFSYNLTFIACASCAANCDGILLAKIKTNKKQTNTKMAHFICKKAVGLKCSRNIIPNSIPWHVREEDRFVCLYAHTNESSILLLSFSFFFKIHSSSFFLGWGSCFNFIYTRSKLFGWWQHIFLYFSWNFICSNDLPPPHHIR